MSDEVLNSALFVLIGLELPGRRDDYRTLDPRRPRHPRHPRRPLHQHRAASYHWRRHWHLGPYTVRTLTWGGLRGGIAIALALSFPAGETRDVALAMTYAVVAFSILVQGLTVENVARRAAA